MHPCLDYGIMEGYRDLHDNDEALLAEARAPHLYTISMLGNHNLSCLFIGASSRHLPPKP